MRDFELADNCSSSDETLERIGVHNHLCLVYESSEEQFAAIASLFKIGLERGERCLYVASTSSIDVVLDKLHAHGVDVQPAVESGALLITTGQQTYLKVGYFDTDTALSFLAGAVAEAKAAGFSALRVAGEASEAMTNVLNFRELIEYEARVNEFLSGHDIVAICQYDRRRFDPKVILDVIRTHPHVMYDEMVMLNHYYVPPDEFLAPDRTAREVERLLHNIQDRARTEAALKAERDRAQRYLDIAGVIIVVIEADGRVRRINRRGCELLGYPEEEIVGKRWIDHFVPDHFRDYSKMQFSQLVSGDIDALASTETPVLTRSGEERIIAWRDVILHDEDGCFRALLSSGEDVTERKQSKQAFTELLALSRALLKPLELEEVFARAVDAAVAIVPAADHGSLQLLLPEGDALHTVAISDLKVSSVLTFRPGEGVAGHALHSRTVVNVPDILEDERFIVGSHPPRFRSLVVAPLIVDSYALGTLSLSSAHPFAFSPIDEALIELIAGQLAAAIENAHMLERMSEALNETHMFAALLEATSDLVGLTDMGRNLLYLNPAGLRMLGYPEDFDYTSLKIEAVYTPEAAHLLIESILPAVMETDIWSGDSVLLHQDGKAIPVSQVVVVVRDDEGVPYALGTIGRDVSADRAAAAEHERLLMTLERRNAQLRAAAEVSTAASSMLDLERLQQKIVDLICDRFGFYYVGLFLLDHEDIWVESLERWVVLRAGTGEKGKEMLARGHKLRVGGESMVGWCVAHARARIAPDVEKEEWHFANPNLPETRSEMALPLISRAIIIGALTIQSQEIDAFSEADVAILQAMANQVANAIENVRLLEQTRRHAAQLSMLNEIGSAVTSLLDLNSILDVIYTQLKQALPLDAFYVALYDAESEMVSYPLMYDEGKRCHEESNILPPETLLGQTIRTATPKMLNRVPEECETTKLKYRMGNEDKPSASLMFAPLQIGTRVMGAISAQSYQVNAYSQAHLNLLSGVATQAAIAIENARLHTEVQQHVAELDRRVEERTEELHQALIRARESDRAKSSFVATVNHELRTPLSNLKLYLGLLERGRPEKRTFYIDTLKREIERLSNLVEDVLSIARLEDGATVEFESVNLAALAQEAISQFIPFAETRCIEFTFVPPSKEGVMIDADPDQIMRVFINLLGNALTYTQSGGAVTLEIDTYQAGDVDWAIVSVLDNGPGIAPEEQAQIFQRFYRGDAGRGSGLPGSGLGLPIVKEIVQLHNGHIELESELGKGSVFNIWLPLR